MCDVANSLISTYVGVPFLEHGRTMKGVDCYGLIKHVYEHALGKKDIPDFIYKNNTAFVFAKEFHKYIIKISEAGAKVGDLVVFSLGCVAPVSVGMPQVSSNRVIHMGVYLGRGKFLHADRNAGVVQGNMNDNRFSSRLVGIFRIIDCE